MRNMWYDRITKVRVEVFRYVHTHPGLLSSEITRGMGKQVSDALLKMVDMGYIKRVDNKHYVNLSYRFMVTFDWNFYSAIVELHGIITGDTPNIPDVEDVKRLLVKERGFNPEDIGLIKVELLDWKTPPSKLLEEVDVVGIN